MQYVWGVRQQTQIRPLDNTVMIIVGVWTHVSRMSAFIFHMVLVLGFGGVVSHYIIVQVVSLRFLSLLE